MKTYTIDDVRITSDEAYQAALQHVFVELLNGGPARAARFLADNLTDPTWQVEAMTLADTLEFEERRA